jgi:bifunctional DNA-binding transcriptional regulator/antitoxin component of YhaV-PrlF toxin-antitoxin module
LPARLRAKYRLDDGDSLTLVDLEGSILLAPKLPVVPKLAAEIDRLRRAAGLRVEDLLGGADSRRGRRHRSRKRR